MRGAAAALFLLCAPAVSCCWSQVSGTRLESAPPQTFLALELAGHPPVSELDADRLGEIVGALGLDPAVAQPIQAALEIASTGGVEYVLAAVARGPHDSWPKAVIFAKASGPEGVMVSLDGSLRRAGARQLDGDPRAGAETGRTWDLTDSFGLTTAIWEDGELHVGFGPDSLELWGGPHDDPRIRDHLLAGAEDRDRAVAIWLDLDAMRRHSTPSFASGRAGRLLSLWSLANARAAMIRGHVRGDQLEMSIAYSARSRPSDDVRVRRFSLPAATGRNALCALPISPETLGGFGLQNLKLLAGDARSDEILRVERRFVTTYTAPWTRVKRAFEGAVSVAAGESGIELAWHVLPEIDARALQRDIDTVVRGIGGRPVEGIAGPARWTIDVPIGPGGGFIACRVTYAYDPGVLSIGPVPVESPP